MVLLVPQEMYRVQTAQPVEHQTGFRSRRRQIDRVDHDAYSEHLATVVCRVSIAVVV